MGSISNCPICGNHVSIPGGVERQAMVRCPLCEAEFPLERALGGAIDPPPELVPVAGLSTGDTDALSVAGDTANGHPPAASATAGLSPAEENSDGLSLADESELRLKEEDPAAMLQTPKEEGASPGDGGKMDEERAESGEVYAVAGEAPGEEESDGEKYVFADQAAGGPAGFGVSGAASVWRRQQAGASVLGQIGKLIGIVVGGLLGVAFAYLALSLVSPAHFDYLHLWGRPKSSAPDGKTPGGSPSAPRGPSSQGRWPGLE